MSEVPLQPDITLDKSSAEQTQFSLPHILRLGTFQIGSAMADILTASVWNRVMIADFGMPATPVGLLLALQYLLLPITFWAGHRSDTQRLWGKRRISYIWFGRAWMVLAMPLLGVSVTYFRDGSNTIGWLFAIVSFFMFGVGKLFSGSVYLALVRESAPRPKQGIAIGVVEMILILFFPITAVAYGRWMEVYDARTFTMMILVTAVLCAFFWFISILRAERDTVVSEASAARIDGSLDEIRSKFKSVWQDGRVRRFFTFLFIATFAAWMQDNILEPFGADVFGLSAGSTTRFTGVWGGATIIVLVACFVIFRKRQPQFQSGIAKTGLFVMAGGLALLALASFMHQSTLLMPGLLIFGIGFGIYTFGGLSLMAVMSPDPDSGAYLGLWTACILLSKGAGTFAGGAFRDLFHLGMGLSEAVTYCLVLAIAAFGLVLAAVILRGREVVSFAADYGRSPHH